MTDLIESQFASTGVAQVMVTLKRGLAAKTPNVSKLAKNFVVDPLSRNMAVRGAVAAGTKLVAKDLPPNYLYFPRLGVALGDVRPQGLAQLKINPAVDRVSAAPDLQLIRPFRKTPVLPSLAASTKATLTWGLKMLDVEKVWKKGWTGLDVKVGHLDTGVDGDHPAFLKGAIKKFEHFDNYGQPTSPTTAEDTDDHGTHTAATILGRPVKGNHFGVAPEARLCSAAVIEGGNALARVLAGMEWALEQEVRILSMSLGFPGWWPDFQPIVETLENQNVLCVFAIGNEYPGTSRSPGNYPEIISVGALDAKKKIAKFSSSQTFSGRKTPLVIAPGVDIFSAQPGKMYQSMDGTSMATPHVAGVAALLAHAAPGASNKQLRNAIIASCEDLGSQGSHVYVHGLPNALRALNSLAPSLITGKPSKEVFPRQP